MKRVGKRIICLLLTAIMLLGVFPVSAMANPSEQEIFMVAGRITDSATKKGLSGATVRLANPSNQADERTDTTDAFGYYQIDVPEGGTYDISASSRGYTGKTESGFVLDAKKDWFAELIPDEGNPCVDIYANIKCVYSGIALPGVTVKAIHSSEGTFTGQTDEYGALIFENVPQGTYTFEVNKTGQPGWESYTSGTHTVTQDQLLTCSLKPNYESLTVQAKGFCAFTETDNSPIRNVTVRLYGLDPKDHDVVLITTAPQTTGVDGTLVFENLVPIDWRIEAYCPGYDSIPKSDSDEDLIVKATAGGTLEQDTVTLDMTFRPATVIANLDSVYDDDERYFDLEVHLCGNDAITEGLTRTITVESWHRPRRAAIFENLLPGQYKIYTYGSCDNIVRIPAGGLQVYFNRLVDSSISPPRRFSITFQGETQAVAKQGKRTEVKLPLEVEKANYSGYLKKIDMDEEGALITSPAANTVMTLHPSEYFPQNPEYGKTYTVTTDESGYYSFNVYPGLYGVTVSGMDDYWGAFATYYRQRYITSVYADEYEECGEYSESAIIGGWPYYQKWQGSHDSAIAYMGYGKYKNSERKYTNNTGYADIGGVPLSSGITEGELFMKEKVCSISVETLHNSLYGWYVVTGKIDDEEGSKPDYKFSTTPFDLANFGTELSCGELTIDNDTSPFPHKFTNLEPGTHDVKITKKAGATIPEYSLHLTDVPGAYGTYWDNWEGSDITFYDFPAPGILPTEFPEDYCSTWDTVWPCGEIDIDLDVRARELRGGALTDLKEYVYYEIVQYDGTREYRWLKDAKYGWSAIGAYLYGWSSDIIPNKLFSAHNGGWWTAVSYPNYVPLTLYFHIPARYVTKYDDKSRPYTDIEPSKWFEMTFDPSTGEGGPTIYVGGHKNNIREGLAGAPAIIKPFKAIIKAKNYYTGEDIEGVSFVNDTTGQVFYSENEYDDQIYLRETFTNDDIDVGGKNLKFHKASFERDFRGDTRLVTLTLYMVPNTALDLTVKDNKDNPVRGAMVQLKSPKGLDELLKTDDLNGVLNVKNLRDESYTLIINAAGYTPYTYELEAGALQSQTDENGDVWKTFVHEAILVPLDQPEISSASFDRYGGFLPHAGRVTSGDDYELVCLLKREENAAKDALTLTVEAALQQQKYDEVTDKVVGMYIIDGKKFEQDDKSREGDYTYIEADSLPDPASPYAVKEWLDKLNNRSEGLENVFFRYFDAECITQRGENSDMADFSGEIMIYELPAGPFKPIFIAVTEKGAYDIYTPQIEKSKQLVGLKKDGFLAFFHTVTDMYLENRPFVLPVFIAPFFEFCPALDEATNLPDFTAEIAEDEENPGYLVYEYSLAVTADGGMANPGASAGSPTSYLPDQLGIEFGGTISATVSGKDLSTESIATLSAGAEFETEKYLPAVISDVATMEGKATGTGSLKGGTEYGSDAKLLSNSAAIGLTGELETTTNISGVGAAGKLFGGGAFAGIFRTIKKWGIDLGVTIDANVGLGVELGMTDNLKTVAAPDKLNADVAIGLGAKAGLYGSAFGGSAGARGTIGFGGEHPKFNSSMMNLDVKFVYDVEKGEFRADPATLKGVCEAEVEAFIDTAIFAASKSWNFKAFNIDMQFGTETKFTLTPVGVKYREINRDTYGTSEFMADENSGLMVKDYLDLASYAADESGSGSFLYTDLESVGGNMRLQLSKFNGNTWQQPVTVLKSDGAIGSYDLITLSNGKILIVYNLIAKKDMYNTFPDSATHYVIGSVSENGWAAEGSGVLAQLSDQYAFKSYLVGSANPRLVCVLTGGQGAKGFDMVGYKWNGTGFGSAVSLKKNLSAFSISVAGNDNEAVAAYVEGSGGLHALSWSGVNTVSDNVVAAETGSSSSVASGANGFYLVCSAKGGIDFYNRGINPGSAWIKKGTPVSNASAIEMSLASAGDKLLLSFIKPSEATIDTAGTLNVGNESIMSVTLSRDGTRYDELRTQMANSRFYRKLNIISLAQSAYAFAVDSKETTADLVFKKIYDADAPVNFLGNVTITGTERFGQQLTAAVSEDNSATKNFTYTWKRDGENIATGAVYTTVEADIGKTLLCEVTADDHAGVISKATGTIGKAEGAAAPEGLVSVPPSAAGASDGKITGTDRTMEYSRTAGGDYTACTGNEITGLSAGTYYVRVAGNETTDAGAYRRVTVGAGGSGGQTSPGGGEQTSPGGGDQTTPGGGEQTAPGGGDQTTPGGGDQTTPGGGDQTVPGGGEQTTPSGVKSSGTISTTDGSEQVDYTASEGAVSLDLSASKTEELISKSKDGNVGFDVSGIKNATSAEMPKEALAAFREAEVSLTVKLPDGSVTLDKEAVDSISKQVGGDKVSVELALVEPEKLNYVQEQSIAANDLIVDANITGGDGRKISNFDGELIMQIPYSGPLPMAVWYLNNAGELEKIESTYENGIVTFRLNHLSVYLLGKDKDRTRGWSNPFTDIKAQAWYYDAIEFVNKNKLMQGVGNNEFDPYGCITRGMMVTLLHRLEKTPDAKVQSSYTDVAADKYYSKAVSWASENRIVSGYGKGLFGPEDPITREQLALILMNYAKYKGYNTSARANLVKFADAKNVSKWAEDAMAWANAEALITGEGKNLNPAGIGDRSQTAVLFRRFITNIH